MSHEKNLSYDRELLSQNAAELQSMNYLSSEGQAIGAGIHLIPLLISTLQISKRILKHASAMVCKDESEGEDGDDPGKIMQSFHLEIREAIQALEDDGYEQAPDLAFELITPHMNWVFCMNYALWSAQMCPFDVIDINPAAFDEDNPDSIEDQLRAFLQVAQEKDAKWSILITKKALEMVYGI